MPLRQRDASIRYLSKRSSFVLLTANLHFAARQYNAPTSANGDIRGADRSDLCCLEVNGENVLKLQTEVCSAAPVTILHSFSCPDYIATAESRVIRAQSVSEAMLDLIAIYMSEGVHRNVRVCRCATRKPTAEPGAVRHKASSRLTQR